MTSGTGPWAHNNINWFKQTLENSDAKYKFVFSHQMVGGIPKSHIRRWRGLRARRRRGSGRILSGAEKTQTAQTDLQRHRIAADFGTTPIHQLMVENGVSAYFHGHDHQYVYETRDGIVYQEVPSPSMSGSGFSGIYTEGDHGDLQYDQDVAQHGSPADYGHPNAGDGGLCFRSDQH